MAAFDKRNSRYWWALTLGLVGACGAGFIIWVILAFARGYIDNPLGWIFVLLPICSVAIALKWRLVGAILLILQGLSLTGLFGLSIIVSVSIVSISEISSRVWFFTVPLIIGVLLMTSGILFLRSQTQQEKL